MQQEALKRIRELGLPNRKTEDWHYFPTLKLSAIAELNFIKDSSAVAFDDSSNVERLSEANLSANDFGISTETDISALLPIALGANTFVKEIADGAVENGILKAHDECSHTVFRIGKNANVSLEILENKIVRKFSAERLDFFVGEGATLELFSTEEGHSGELKFRSVRIHQAKNSNVHVIGLNRSESLLRMDVEAFLDGEEANFGFRELNLVSNQANANYFLRVSHNAPHCTSRQFVRNLISGSAVVSYDGGVNAGKDCPGTDSSELINTLLLSDDAKICVKPTLKIYNDDVACSHGNTIGALDEDSIFYLESRGLNKKSAEELLIRAFAKDVIAEHPFEPAKQRLSKVLLNALETSNPKV